ncbi:hypothetical protein Bca52824_080856 [Brassica carinata]|uniref:GATA-type domain-containing protein n=1 Tax=Brassica carinata TaxID=52824 RepID=A0A8X7PGA7_BRACI|nr:hypothetical protein Bca52824_080856 [Brassica carinata]
MARLPPPSLLQALRINTNKIGEDHLSASAGHIPYNEIEEIPNHPCTQPPEGPNQLTISMPRNKGQLSSDGAYNSGTDQDSAQDDSRPEISCLKTCKFTRYHTCTPMMRRGPSGPRTLCYACGLFWAARGELGSDADANNSNYEPATVEEHSALVSLANGDNSNMLVYIIIYDSKPKVRFNPMWLKIQRKSGREEPTADIDYSKSKLSSSLSSLNSAWISCPKLLALHVQLLFITLMDEKLQLL